MIISLSIGVMLFSLSAPFSVNAGAASVTPERILDQALCLPGQIESFAEIDCADLGPNARLKELAAKGITFPAEPLPIYHPPADLINIPFAYAIVSNDAVPLYANIENAIAGNAGNTLIASQIKYVSLYNKTETEKGRFYQIATYEWLSSEYVRKVSIPNFQGYLFKSNPTVNFGWAMDTITSRSAPGPGMPETGNVYYKYSILHIYDTQVIGDTEWVMIGVNEWIASRYIARVLPNYTKPEGVTGERWIEINLAEQVLLVYDSGRLVFATLISSGSHPFYTQPGVFQVYKMLVNDRMSGSFEADRADYYYLEDVPYILYYDQLRAIHGAYWNNYLGDQGSHGCVNMSVADAHWIFDWAKEGDFVYVWDPTGKTPTDPSLYGAGGF
jgi:hypothetical protein